MRGQKSEKKGVGAISSSIAWFILEQADTPSLYKAICCGVIAVISPEIINGIIKLGKKFQADLEKFIKNNFFLIKTILAKHLVKNV